MRDFRYCRYRRTHNKEYSMFKCGLSPTISDEGKAAWVALKAAMLMHCQAVEKEGVAPKSDLERRLDAICRKLKIIS